MLNPTADFKYIIRPDGRIRVVTKGKIRMRDDEFVVLSKQRFHPGKFKYNFEQEAIIGINPSEIAAARVALQAADAQSVADAQGQLNSLKSKVQALTGDQRDAFELLGDVLGVDLRS
jgi:hypothetical protein